MQSTVILRCGYCGRAFSGDAQRAFAHHEQQCGNVKTSRAIMAVIRESDGDEIMIEVCFSDGQKFSAIQVDSEHLLLAQEICNWINTRSR